MPTNEVAWIPSMVKMGKTESTQEKRINGTDNSAFFALEKFRNVLCLDLNAYRCIMELSKEVPKRQAYCKVFSS